MNSIQDYGLPSLVLDLLDQQAKQTGLQIDFNISKRGEVVRLNLVWTPAINSQQYNSAPTCNVTKPNFLKGYRKKNPSELERDRRRMDNFRSQKKESIVYCSTDQSVQTCAASTVDSDKNSDNSDCKTTGMKTRQQTAKLRNDSVEMPRYSRNDAGLSLFDEGLCSIDNTHVESPISMISVTSMHSDEHSSPAPVVVSDLEPGHNDLPAQDSDTDSSEDSTDMSGDGDNELLSDDTSSPSESCAASEAFLTKKFDELMKTLSHYTDTND